jgi:hypothetical protein
MMQKNLPWVRANGTHLVTEDGTPILLRGMGLGGWLLPEGYMWRLPRSCDRPRRIEKLVSDLCGQSYAQSFWEHYQDWYITEADISLIKQQGLNSIRIPFNTRNLFDIGTGTITFNIHVLDLIDRCIGWCHTHGVYVILDMHGAPGGQTGANIDDSEHDQPELFQNERFQQQCVQMWYMLAQRYAEDSTVVGYDLMNEPLPEWFSAYDSLVMPLYRRIRDAIRSVDTRHMLIIEGTHWSTNWTIFDGLREEPFDDNCLLQFHKYWNNPDRDSIAKFLNYRERLGMPIFMGEGGENNLWWYTALFPLLEQLDISWNFWTYKKMDCANSPISFGRPLGWNMLEQVMDASLVVSREQAIALFDDFLVRLRWDHPEHRVNLPMLRALKRELPLDIPAECFDFSHITGQRSSGALVRLDQQASIEFCDRHQGQVGYCRQAGEPQPEDQWLCVALHSGEALGYRVVSSSNDQFKLVVVAHVEQASRMSVRLNGQVIAKIELSASSDFRRIELCEVEVVPGMHALWIEVERGALRLHLLQIESRESAV